MFDAYLTIHSKKGFIWADFCHTTVIVVWLACIISVLENSVLTIFLLGVLCNADSACTIRDIEVPNTR